MLSIEEELKQQVSHLQNDLISLRVEVINLKNQVTMLQGMVNGLQSERAQREKTLVSEIHNCMQNNVMIKSYIQDEIEKGKTEAFHKAKQSLIEMSDSI